MSSPTSLDVARRWVTEGVEALFQAEISNERHGGVTPSTLSSTIDSVSQGLPLDNEEGEPVDVVSLLIALLVIRDLLPGDTSVRELL